VQLRSSRSPPALISSSICFRYFRCCLPPYTFESPDKFPKRLPKIPSIDITYQYCTVVAMSVRSRFKVRRLGPSCKRNLGEFGWEGGRVEFRV